MNIVELKDVSRIYHTGEHEIKALDNVNLTIEKGKFVVVLGPSGAGKSTLLNLLGGLDSPTSGTIIVDGDDISVLNISNGTAGRSLRAYMAYRSASRCAGETAVCYQSDFFIKARACDRRCR